MATNSPRLCGRLANTLAERVVIHRVQHDIQRLLFVLPSRLLVAIQRGQERPHQHAAFDRYGVPVAGLVQKNIAQVLGQPPPGQSWATIGPPT